MRIPDGKPQGMGVGTISNWAKRTREGVIHFVLRTLRPLTAFQKCPKFVQNLSRGLFFGVPIRGTQIYQTFVEKMKKLSGNSRCSILDRFLTSLGPLIGDPSNNRRDKFLDKFEVRGICECCKGAGGFGNFVGVLENPFCSLPLKFADKL